MVDDIHTQGVELGCGENKEDGFFGVDKIETEDTDCVFDLDEEDWPLPKNSFAKIRAVDVLEHLDNPVQFLDNVYQIAEDGGEVYISGPHLSSNNWHDPTHKRLLGTKTIRNYFTQNGEYSFYSDACFREKKVRINFYERKLFAWNYILYFLVNYIDFTRHIFEETFLSRLFPATNIEFWLEVDKA